MAWCFAQTKTAGATPQSLQGDMWVDHIIPGEDGRPLVALDLNLRRIGQAQFEKMKEQIGFRFICAAKAINAEVMKVFESAARKMVIEPYLRRHGYLV